ncbi:hypothetical protein E6H22_01350 [Candidatus Bathyarchaeota archaeon]|nr:MAG: hypothetical protein E6H22_01350 [Candidatus Bathyarchaeota archaeon]
MACESLTLTLILAESSIELVPNEIAGHPAILSWARRKKKDPHRLILDQSYHHSAILRLGGSGVGRGRPDIAHFSLLVALGSPLTLNINSDVLSTREMIMSSPSTRVLGFQGTLTDSLPYLSNFTKSLGYHQEAFP